MKGGKQNYKKTMRCFHTAFVFYLDFRMIN